MIGDSAARIQGCKTRAASFGRENSFNGTRSPHFDVVQQVWRAIRAVSPRHGGTDGAHGRLHGTCAVARPQVLQESSTRQILGIAERARKCGAIRSRGRRIDRRRHPFGRLCRRRLGRLASVSVRSQLQQSNLSAACTLRQQLFSLLVVFGASEGRAAARSSAHWAFGILSASSANVLLDAAKAEDVLAGQLVRVALRVHAD